jgi:hypothetical protein
VEDKSGRIRRVRYWEIIADNLSKAGWSWGCVATMDRDGRTIFVADANRGDGSPFRCAISYATCRACFRSGEIRIFDTTGRLERTIPFNEADRML